jgi:tetratricopeptide (TPR) repeat protein
MMLRARAGIGASFAGKPALEAEVRETIGLLLLGLGRPREGTEETEQAVAIRRASLGDRHPDTLRSRLQLALGLTESGRAPEAVPLLRELRQTMTELYGERDPRTLQASSLLANALMEDREHDAADPIFEKTQELQREVLGEDHRDTLMTMLWWACSLEWRGRGTDAENLSRPAYEASLRRYGPDDVLTLSARSELGWSLLFVGDREEAEAMLRPAVDGLSRALGDSHPYTAAARMALGRAIEGRGNGEDQVEIYTKALEGLRASQGKASPTIWIISRDLAFLLLRRGRTDEGLDLLRRAVEDFRDKYGEEHSWTTDNMAYLVEGLENAGRRQEAVEVSKQLLAIRRRQAEEPQADASVVATAARELLTWNPADLRDPAAALPLAKRALELAEEGDRDWILDTFALALSLNGHGDEAIKTQREALAHVAANDEFRRSLYTASLVRYLADTGPDRDARETIEERVRQLQAASDSAADFVNEIGSFSNMLADHELHAQAELARRQALGIVRAEWNDDPAAAAGLLYRIGRSLLHQGKSEEAERVLREGLSYARRTDDDWVRARVEINLAEALIHEGRLAEARDLAAGVVDRRRSDPSVGQASEVEMEAERLLGTARLRLGNARAAEPLLREAAEWFVWNAPAESWRRARAQSAWGECLLALGRLEEAEPLLLESKQSLETTLGGDATATQDAERRVARL